MMMGGTPIIPAQHFKLTCQRLRTASLRQDRDRGPRFKRATFSSGDRGFRVGPIIGDRAGHLPVSVFGATRKLSRNQKSIGPPPWPVIRVTESEWGPGGPRESDPTLSSASSPGQFSAACTQRQVQVGTGRSASARHWPACRSCLRVGCCPLALALRQADATGSEGGSLGGASAGGAHGGTGIVRVAASAASAASRSRPLSWPPSGCELFAATA
jgi:hypothetical protein